MRSGREVRDANLCNIHLAVMSQTFTAICLCASYLSHPFDASIAQVHDQRTPLIIAGEVLASQAELTYLMSLIAFRVEIQEVEKKNLPECLDDERGHGRHSGEAGLPGQRHAVLGDVGHLRFGRRPGELVLVMGLGDRHAP